MAGVGRRGAEIRYWEDVVEGEQLKELAAGPLDITDSCVFDDIYPDTAFAMKWHSSQMRKKAAKKAGQTDMPARTDPDTGAPRYGNPHIAYSPEYGGSIAFGAQTEGVLAKLVTNWMGDDGFVKKLNCQMRRIWLFGHILWLNGKVTRKYIEDGEHLVDMELTGENQDGLLVMPVSATVRLDAREHTIKPSEAF